MAQTYKDYDNVIYEICNEPNGGITWTGGIKSYCQSVVSTIRKYDSDAIIIQTKTAFTLFTSMLILTEIG